MKQLNIGDTFIHSINNACIIYDIHDSEYYISVSTGHLFKKGIVEIKKSFDNNIYKNLNKLSLSSVLKITTLTTISPESKRASDILKKLEQNKKIQVGTTFKNYANNECIVYKIDNYKCYIISLTGHLYSVKKEKIKEYYNNGRYTNFNKIYINSFIENFNSNNFTNKNSIILGIINRLKIVEYSKKQNEKFNSKVFPIEELSKNINYLLLI